MAQYLVCHLALRTRLSFTRKCDRLNRFNGWFRAYGIIFELFDKEDEYIVVVNSSSFTGWDDNDILGRAKSI